MGSVCFHCAGALEHWEPSVNAWTEQSYWFPFCVFLRYVKGDTYIRESRRLRSQQMYATVETDWINLIFTFFSLSLRIPTSITNSFKSNLQSRAEQTTSNASLTD
jgi:hypothetical protein